jgi:hypothetical protein
MSAWTALQPSADFMLQYIFKSSTNKRNLECLIISERSLTKILKKRGPRVNPCGAPDNTEKGDENFPIMLTKEDLFNK